MPEGPSILSLIAAGFYVVVVAGCCAAAFVSRLPPVKFTHFRMWVGLAVFFAALAVMRALDLEALFQQQVRDFFESHSAYDDRRDWQSPVLASGAAGAVFAAFWGASRVPVLAGSRDRIVVSIAGAAALGMVFLVFLRLVSLHAIDRFLYDYKLNWIGDMGLSMAVLCCAVMYVRTRQTIGPRN